jgi:hypothetical protein
MPKRIDLSGNTDPNARDKDRLEEEIAKFFAEQFELQYAELQRELRRRQEVPGPDFWEDWAATFAAFLIVSLQSGALTSAETEQEITDIGVPFDDLAAEINTWASTLSLELARSINNRTRASLQDALRVLETTGDIDALIEGLAPMFSLSRAENIAITETTGAFAQGVQAYVRGLNAQGVTTDEIWHTKEDERVCIICEPNQDKLGSEGSTAPDLPAHPRDRCWITTVLII